MSHVTLTLTSDDLETHIIVNDSSTLTNSTIWSVSALSLIVDFRTYVRTNGRTDGRTDVDGRTYVRTPSVRPYVHNQTQCSHKPNSGIC